MDQHYETAIAGNLRTIALPTLVTVLIPETERDRANGPVGTVNGVAFLGASIVSGLAIGFLGMYWMLVGAIALSVLTILHLCTIAIPEQLTAFMIGPIAHCLFIPFMTTGAGVELIGSWFGTGTDRGIALLFTLTGSVGLVVTVLAMRRRRTATCRSPISAPIAIVT